MPSRALSPRLALLAVVAPALAVVPWAMPNPASAARPDAPAAAYRASEWMRNSSTPLPDEPYTRVEVTYSATYGIALDGSVRTASDDPGWAPPAFDRPIVDITARPSRNAPYGLAIDDEGTLHSWGAAPAIPDEDRQETYRDVVAGEQHAIGVTSSGELRLWGTATGGELDFDPEQLADSDVVSVDTGSSASVAVTADGRLLIAGGAITSSWSPEFAFPAERAGETIVAADVGHETAVALTADGEVIAWGTNNFGERDVPEFPEGRHAVAVSAGMWMSAAVLDDGSVVRWGQGEYTEIPAAPAGVDVLDIDLDRYRAAVTYGTVAATSAPALSTDQPVVGDEVSVSGLEWSVTPDSVSYAWTVDGEGRGTDAASYTPTAEDEGGDLAVTVTATKDGYLAGTVTVTADEPVDVPPFETAPTVTIEGTPRVDQPLTATVTESVPAADAVEYQWWAVPPGYDPEGEGSEGPFPIGDNEATYTPTADLVGHTIEVEVVAFKAGFQPAPASASAEAPVAVGLYTEGLHVDLVGTPQVGTAYTPTLTGPAPAADELEYEWVFLPAGGGEPTPIAGADQATFTPGPDLAGLQVGVHVTATRAGYAPASDGAIASAPVAPGAFAPPHVSVVGTPRVGQVLTGTVQSDPKGTTTYQWLRGEAPITGATQTTYRLTEADRGATLRLRATTRADGYTDATAVSASTGVVGAGPGTLTVSAPKKVQKGKKLRVRIGGLVPGETFRVTLGKATVDSVASAAGTGTVKLKVKTSPGRQQVTVIGAFADRTGTAKVRVVRPRKR